MAKKKGSKFLRLLFEYYRAYNWLPNDDNMAEMLPTAGGYPSPANGQRALHALRARGIITEPGKFTLRPHFTAKGHEAYFNFVKANPEPTIDVFNPANFAESQGGSYDT